VARHHPTVARQRPRRRLVSEGQITLCPAGFDEAKWWHANQVENIDLLLDRLKRTYNVDENHVHLMGFSDGGTGVYFFAMRSATAWSALFPFHGAPGVLANPAMRADGDLYATNLAAKPIYAVNGGRDPLYPIPVVRPYLALFAAAGANVTFRGLLEAGHDSSWWPAERPRVEAFEASHPRDPLPDRLSWRTERTDRYNRLHWLVIDALGAGRSETPFEDPNTIELEGPVDFGLRVDARTGDPRKVVAVIDGTPAQAMGLRKGDLLLEIGGAPIRTADDIADAYDRHRAGTPLRFAVERRGQRVQMEVEFPPPPPSRQREEAFRRSRLSGRVDLVRRGNRVEARTAGVTAFTLLLSPAQFDFAQPISVVVNGKAAFEGRVEKSVATLLQWAARDNDRTMLFAAELKVEVP
jgi:predicted esterase